MCCTGDMRQKVYAGMVRQIEAGRQVYVVCALIEERKVGRHPQRERCVCRIQKKTGLKNIPCGLLHGKLKPEEKDEIMEAFAAGKLEMSCDYDWH